MTITKKQIWLAAGLFAAALALLLWYWLDGSCENPGRRLAIKQAGGVGCFEFWLNRYQSGLAGLLALAAAFVAGRYALRAARIAAEPVSRQLALAQIQASIAAIPVLLEIKARVTAEFALQADANSILVDCRNIYDEMRLGDDGLTIPRSRIDDITQRCQKTHLALDRLISELPIAPETDKVRSALSSYCSGMDVLLQPYAKFLGDFTQGGIPDVNGRKYLAEMTPRMHSHIETLYNGLIAADHVLRFYATSIDRSIAVTQDVIGNSKSLERPA